MRSVPPLEPERFLRAFLQADADFVVVGGFAVIIHGGEQLTKDIDFAVAHNRQNARAIASALAPFNPRPAGFSSDLPFVWDEQMILNSSLLTLDTSIGRIDLLTEL